jgi:hypothetical protein
MLFTQQKQLLLIVGITSFLGMTFSTSAQILTNDQQALEHCKVASHGYVAIVWPRGIDDLAYIVKALKNRTDIRYIKQFSLDKAGMFGLYRQLHKKMSRSSAKKYFKPYITSAIPAPFQLAAIVFDAEEELEAILAWKKEIRDHIGQSYYSIHINDRCQPETFEAAQAVFSHEPIQDVSC